MSPTNSKYIKLGLIFLVPVFIGLTWRGFVSIITGGKPSNTEQLTGSITDTGTTITQQPATTLTQPNLGGTVYNGGAITLTIAVPEWFDTNTMSGTMQALKNDKISIKRLILTGGNYYSQLWHQMLSGTVDLSLISTDYANDCGQGCALAFDYSQPIDAFVLSPVSEAIRDTYRTMIPYGIDPIVTYHNPSHKVSSSRGSLFNNILINTSDSTTAGSLPLAIGIGAADKALLRAGKESYPGYAQLLHELMIQFSQNETLLGQLTQLADDTQLRSYTRMNKTIATISEKFPLCQETVAACLVRFNVSYYGFGYLSDLMRLPTARQSTIKYDQFPIETNYYPVRLWGFVVNRRSKATVEAVSRFVSVYVTDMINTSPTTGSTQLLSPRTSRYETQGYDEQYTNIMRYTDSFAIIRGGSKTALDRVRNRGLMSVLEGQSSIQVYLSQQGIK